MTQLTKKWVVPTLSIALISGLVAFRQKKPVPPTPPPAPSLISDTLPAPKPPAPPRIADFSDAHRELDRAAAEMEKALKNLKIPEPPIAPIAPEIDRAAIDKALRDLDPEKIRADVARSLKDIDSEKIRKEVDAQLAAIDVAAIRKEVDASMRKMTESLAQQKVDLAKMELELKEIGPKVEASMQQARKELAKAKEELEAYEAFVNNLAADGLLNKNNYTIEHNDGKLIINGKEQSQAVYDKYRSFLENKKNIRITKNNNGLNISKNQ